MGVTRRMFLGIAAATAAVSMTSCAKEVLKPEVNAEPKKVEEALESGDVAAAQLTGTLALNQGAWRFDPEHDVFWQLDVPYCSKPTAPDYQTLGLFVPAAYLNAQDNGDGTFTCSIGEGSFAGFSAQTAPILVLSDTENYAARRSPQRFDYPSMAKYLDGGFVCVQPGYRGRQNGYDTEGNLTFPGGAPWGITDLKAAIRYIRYNDRLIPGSPEHIFAYGRGYTGSQSIILGASGDSSLYRPYLESIGAAMRDDDGDPISDSVAGVICWNPIACFDQVNAAYEWMLGQYSNEGSREDGLWTAALSQHLAERFAEYVNDSGFTAEGAGVLELNRSTDSIFAAGSYYDHIVSVIEESLNNFLLDTTFPYEIPATAENPDSKPLVFKTPEDYIAALNARETWISYDEKAKTASISSVEAFVRNYRQPDADVGAFDALDRTAFGNELFCTEEEDALHFDSSMADLLQINAGEYADLEGWEDEFPSEYANDLDRTDSMGSSMSQRVNMYNPLYYLCDCYEGFGTSNVASHWRIHSGMKRTLAPLAAEVNLSLALNAIEGIETVEFMEVWNEGDTRAERMGNPTENAIAWVKHLLLG